MYSSASVPERRRDDRIDPRATRLRGGGLGALRLTSRVRGLLCVYGIAFTLGCAPDAADIASSAHVATGDAPLAAVADTGVEAAAPAAAEDDAAVDSAPSTRILPPVSSVDTNGPFATTQDLSGGPRGRSGIFRPTDLGRNGLKHPIFVWGCGGGSTPTSYADQLRRIASHGFVVIAEVSQIGDNGAPLTAALAWLTAEAARPQSAFYGKLATDLAAVGGHSIGSVNSFIVAPDPRWKTSIHVAGGSLDDVRNPRAPTTGLGGRGIVHPTAYICSENDVFGNVEKTKKDYERTSAPVFFTIMAGTEHVGAAREGLPVVIAWLRWHLGGETERRSMFLDAQGQFRIGRYNSQIKNWP